MSVAFKNLVTPRRTTWRTILAVEQSGASQSQLASIAKYKAVIEERLHKDCEEIVQLVSKTIIPRLDSKVSVEERAFFWKMIGDYFRYASEASSSQASKE